MTTEIACVIDRSGSMSSVVDDAIGGLNTFIADQKMLPGEARLMVSLFDHEYTTVFSGDLISAPKLTRETYVPRGSTALYDAIGRTIDEIGSRLKEMPPETRPAKVIIVILTDGQENSSHRYSKQRIADMVRHQREKYNWDFIFLAANQDAFAEGAALNVARHDTMSWVGDSGGTQSAFASASLNVRSKRGA